MKLLVLCAVLLAGCGTQGIPRVDPELQQYVSDFEMLTGVANTSDVLFVEGLDRDLAGVCTDGETVRISRAVWLRARAEVSKRSIVYHELGHCNLGREHSPDPASYMHSPRAKFSDVEGLHARVRLELVGY